MKIKGVLMSLLVFVIFLGFLPIEKANASVSSDVEKELVDRIDVNKRYFVVPADSPTKGINAISSMLVGRLSLPVVLGTVENPGATSLKFHYSEENKKYRIEYPEFLIIDNIKIDKWISYNHSLSWNEERLAHYWTITPVEGGYTIQAEDNGYLNYREIISSWDKPATIVEVSDKKSVWKLIPVI
ncbi:hypothetical protein COL60_27780 [Bacillus pseudomycoides]|uniref:hypothetical protein n=1 Tax=Bacillus pseudomycoides TaxID=64104 RepID=UPI000BEDAFB9|nr:hypothetical protein [Bacillus pseudomycoides]PEA81006.1 hypothetical protein CON99_25050 [Bacillus pseudomycoides]PFZ02294.1 hypothetical protein COL60_27780 [Bacillus pseudomycoides]